MAFTRTNFERQMDYAAVLAHGAHPRYRVEFDAEVDTATDTKKTVNLGIKQGSVVYLDSETGKYNLILGSDGFYHLGSAEGPVVLVRLGKDSKYLACFQTILDNSGVSRYFFHEDGSFIKKVSYSECLLEYIANMDEETGVYPLTEDLKHIIQQRGEYVGWFDTNSSLYLFEDANGVPIPGVNPEISWLFMCCYLMED